MIAKNQGDQRCQYQTGLGRSGTWSVGMFSLHQSLWKGAGGEGMPAPGPGARGGPSLNCCFSQDCFQSADKPSPCGRAAFLLCKYLYKELINKALKEGLSLLPLILQSSSAAALTGTSLPPSLQRLWGSPLPRSGALPGGRVRRSPPLSGQGRSCAHPRPSRRHLSVGEAPRGSGVPRGAGSDVSARAEALRRQRGGSMVAAGAHRPGPLKQQNKAHKGGKHSGSSQRRAGGEAGRARSGSSPGLRAAAFLTVLSPQAASLSRPSPAGGSAISAGWTGGTRRCSSAGSARRR